MRPRPGAPIDVLTRFTKRGGGYSKKEVQKAQIKTNPSNKPRRVKLSMAAKQTLATRKET